MLSCMALPGYYYPPSGAVARGVAVVPFGSGIAVPDWLTPTIWPYQNGSFQAAITLASGTPGLSSAAPDGASGLWTVSYDGMLWNQPASGQATAVPLPQGSLYTGCALAGGSVFVLTSDGDVLTGNGSVLGSFATPALAFTGSGSTLAALLPASGLGTMSTLGVRGIFPFPSALTVPACLTMPPGRPVAVAGWSVAAPLAAANAAALGPDPTVMIGVGSGTVTLWRAGLPLADAWNQTQRLTSGLAALTAVGWSPDGFHAMAVSPTSGVVQILSYAAGVLALTQTLAVSGACGIVVGTDSLHALVAQSGASQLATLAFSGSWAVGTPVTGLPGITTVVPWGSSGAVAAYSSGLAYLGLASGLWSITDTTNLGFTPTLLAVDAFLDVYAAASGQFSVVDPTGALRGSGSFSGVPTGLAVQQGRVVLAVPASNTLYSYGQATTAPNDAVTSDSGYILWSYWENPGPDSIVSMTCTFTVPPAPTNQGDQTINIFPALEPFGGSGYILQPLLIWTTSSPGGIVTPPPGVWSIASWYVSGPTVNEVSDFVVVEPGTILTAVIQCTGVNQYKMYFNGYPNTTINVTTPSPATSALVALECYNLTTCSSYPAGQIVFSDIHINTGTPGTGGSPATGLIWTPVTNFSDCGLDLTINSSSEITIGVNSTAVYDWTQQAAKTLSLGASIKLALSETTLFAMGSGSTVTYGFSGTPFTLTPVVSGVAAQLVGGAWRVTGLGVGHTPNAMTYDASGNLRIATTQNNILSLSPGGTIMSTIPIAQIPQQDQSVPLGVSAMMVSPSGIYCATSIAGVLTEISSAGVTGAFVQALSDSSAGSDTWIPTFFGGTGTFSTTLSDNMAGTDSLSPAFSVGTSIGQTSVRDVVVASENIAANLFAGTGTFLAGISDTIVGTENISATVFTGAGAFTRSLADSIVATDTLTTRAVAESFSDSIAASDNLITFPAAVVNLRQASATINSMNMIWDAPQTGPGNYVYTLSYSINGGTTTAATIQSISAPNYNLTGLQPANLYAFDVVAVDQQSHAGIHATTGEWSTLAVTTPVTGESPAGTTITAVGSSVTNSIGEVYSIAAVSGRNVLNVNGVVDTFFQSVNSITYSKHTVFVTGVGQTVVPVPPPVTLVIRDTVTTSDSFTSTKTPLTVALNPSDASSSLVFSNNNLTVKRYCSITRYGAVEYVCHV